MFTNLPAVVLAATLIGATPTLAAQSLLPYVAKVDAMLKDVTPEYRCEVVGGKKICSQTRVKVDENNGTFTAYTFTDIPNLNCFYPAQTAKNGHFYGLCGTHNKAIPVLIGEKGDTFVALPENDERCKQWGAFDTIEYLACEVAQPRK